jgi:hypothetical protein
MLKDRPAPWCGIIAWMSFSVAMASGSYAISQMESSAAMTPILITALVLTLLCFLLFMGFDTVQNNRNKRWMEEEPKRQDQAIRLYQRGIVLDALKQHLGKNNSIAVLALHVEFDEEPALVMLEREMAIELFRRGIRTVLIEDPNIRTSVRYLPTTRAELFAPPLPMSKNCAEALEEINHYCQNRGIRYILYFYRDWVHDPHPAWMMHGVQQKADILQKTVDVSMDGSQSQTVDDILDNIKVSLPLVGKLKPVLEKETTTLSAT